MIIEAKHSKRENALEEDCISAVDQIAVKKYAQEYLDGYKMLICYGMAFYKKTCMVKFTEIGDNLRL